MTGPAPAIPPQPTITVQPYHLADREPFAYNWLSTSHQEALYGYGEYTMFILLWLAKDVEDGLVGICPLCSQDRISKAYRQPTRSDCANCFGTGFDGGYRARIVRPAIWADDNIEDAETQRGSVQSANVSLETTNDFTLHNYDIAIRSNNDRYRAAQAGDTTYLRTGFGQPQDVNATIGMNVASMRLEEESSLAYRIPPVDPTYIATTLAVPPGQRTPEIFTAAEDIRGPLLD